MFQKPSVARGAQIVTDARKGHLWWLWPGALVLLLLLSRITLGFGPWGENSIDAAAAVRNQKVTTAKRADLNVDLNALGTVTPFRTVTVHTRVDGELTRLYVREGQMVKAGDLIAEVDPRPYQVQLAEADGQMARDRASLVNARSQLARYTELFAQKIISKKDLDTQEYLLRQYAGAVMNDQALIDRAKLNLAYCRITSPISGRVSSRLFSPGDIVHIFDTQGLMAITELQPIAVIFSIAGM